MSNKESPISLTEKSSNKKLGDNVAATYAPIEQTCPSSCQLKNDGCYAQMGFVGIQNARLTRNARKGSLNATALAKLEAKLIDESFKGKQLKKKTPLRLHVSGDVKTKTGVKYLSASARRYIARGGGKVWTYSHAWSKLPKSLWNGISVLASCDTIREAKEALKAGYAPAMVVPEFESEKAYMIEGIKGIPCPEQTRGVTCQNCGLCMNADKLVQQNSMILFAVHGARSEKFKLKVMK
jgi:hypothetical protein